MNKIIETLKPSLLKGISPKKMYYLPSCVPTISWRMILTVTKVRIWKGCFVYFCVWTCMRALAINSTTWHCYHQYHIVCYYNVSSMCLRLRHSINLTLGSAVLLTKYWWLRFMGINIKHEGQHMYSLLFKTLQQSTMKMHLLVSTLLRIERSM